MNSYVYILKIQNKNARFATKCSKTQKHMNNTFFQKNTKMKLYYTEKMI